MLKHWRIPLFWALVVAVALWIRWWASWNFALEHQINTCKQAPDDCGSYNVVFFSAWRFASALNHWSALVAAAATVAIGYFTLTFKWSTDKLWSSGEKQAAAALIAANAADLSARAAIAIELPIIKMSLPGLVKSTTIQNEIRTENISVQFVTFTNLGRTKAFPIELRYGFAVGTLPAIPRYAFSDSFQYDDIFEALPPKEFKRNLTAFHELLGNEANEIASGKLPVWFFCELVYLDFMQDKPRDAAYCWRVQYLGQGAGWRPYDHPSYNH